MAITSTDVHRRRWVGSAGVAVFCPVVPCLASAHGDSPHIEVWKDADCGCCGLWVKHLQNHNFSVKVNDVEDTAEIRKGLGMPAAHAACHTARVGGYVIEGHVPALDILRVLRERPQARGLTVPEMPPVHRACKEVVRKTPMTFCLSA